MKRLCRIIIFLSAIATELYVKAHRVKLRLLTDNGATRQPKRQCCFRRVAKLLRETDVWGGELGHSLQLTSFPDSLLSLKAHGTAGTDW